MINPKVSRGKLRCNQINRLAKMAQESPRKLEGSTKALLDTKARVGHEGEGCCKVKRLNLIGFEK